MIRGLQAEIMQQFGWNLFLTRIASGSYHVTEDVSWLLSHTQVADDKPAIVDMGTDEILRKPARSGALAQVRVPWSSFRDAIGKRNEHCDHACPNWGFQPC